MQSRKSGQGEIDGAGWVCSDTKPLVVHQSVMSAAQQDQIRH